MKDPLKRLKEPSSYASIAAVLMLFGVNIDPGLYQHIAHKAAAVAGIVGFFVSEQSN